MEAMLGSSIPSARLEHEAHRLGLREREFSESAILSPQQMQIVGFISQWKSAQTQPAGVGSRLYQDSPRYQLNSGPLSNAFYSPIRLTEAPNRTSVKGPTADQNWCER